MSPQALTAAEEQRLYATKTYLLNHLHQRITVRQMAQYSALGQQKFRDGFYRLFQMPVKDYLHEARMQTARVLLVHTDKPIKAIAGSCGYRYYKNFITAYRKTFGRTPSAERV